VSTDARNLFERGERNVGTGRLVRILATALLLALAVLAMTFIDTSAPVEWESLKCFHLDGTRVSCQEANRGQ
jgi:hypothetical protein